MFVPSFKLYASNGTTPVYTFNFIIDTNYPQDNPSSIILTNNRSLGSIIIPQGNKSWDLNLTGILIASDYSGLVTAKDSIISTIAPNTRYVLKIDTTLSTTDDFKVMRVLPIIWNDSNKRTYQYYEITFLTDSWA